MGWLVNLLKRGSAGNKAGDKIQRGVLMVALVLLLAMIIVAVTLTVTTHAGGTGVTSFVLFSAASAAGALLGFLFGLPRARVSDLASGDASPASPTAKPSTYYLTNSNLIKVSDWLTTIVIGLGLANLAKIRPAVRNLSHALEAPLGNAPYSGAVGVSILIVGLLAGFLLNYLWTSIRVRELLEEAEQENQQQVPVLTDRTVAEARVTAGEKDLKLLVPPGTPEDATVVAQTLAPGTTVPKGTGLTVSMIAPSPPPPADPAPEGDVTN